MHDALRRRRQAGRDDALGLELLDVVERRPADDGLLPQHDRPAHRDDRQPDADDDPVRAVASSCRDGDLPLPDRAAGRGTSASRSTTRSPPTTRCSTSRRATARTSSSTSTRWARTRSSAAARDTWTPTPRRVDRRAGGGDRGRGRRRRRRRRRCARWSAARRRASPELFQKVLRDPAGARSARLHPARRPAGLPDRDEVRQRADQDRRHRAPRDGAVHRRRASSIRPARTS